MALELKANWLDNLHIATPCRADWERMDWEDAEGRIRFCRTCEKNVYNISLMSREEALDLIRAKEGQLCLRLAKRQDGTLITNDCPVGQNKRQTKRRFMAIFSTFLLGVIPSPLSNSLAEASAWFLRGVPGMEGVADVVASQPLRKLVVSLQKPNPHNEPAQVIMGGPPPAFVLQDNPPPSQTPN